MQTLDQFKEIWMVDFEFGVKEGNPPEPICMVAKELKSKNRILLWQDELNRLSSPPFDIGPESVFIAYYAIAEFSCFAVLNWEFPKNVIDLFVEFRCLTNGHKLSCGNGLIGALIHHGLDAMEVSEKNEMRALALRGGPWSEIEKQALLEYCEKDVIALECLIPKMLPSLNVGQALHRGRYIKAAAMIEHNGIPIDTDSLKMLKDNWEFTQENLIDEFDRDYHIFEGRTFKTKNWERWLSENGISWPRLPTGNLDMQDKTFKDMSKKDIRIAPIHELRTTLSKMRLSDLRVGEDGRNRTSLSVFRSITGRNQPSSAGFVFGNAVWLRSLIQPREGWGIAYIDWTQQEFGIAAALSEDESMMAAYNSEDCYLAFAKQAGAVPQNATKQTHPHVREQFKQCVLAVQYGMGKDSLALRINQPVAKARELLTLHRNIYRTFWRWSDGVVDTFMCKGEVATLFGWKLHLPRFSRADVNPRSVRNFPVQGTGAELLRLALCYAVESGIRVCAPVHDAILIEAPLKELDAAIHITQEAMKVAGMKILDGFVLRTDAKVFRHPERYVDDRGKEMWERVWGIVNRRIPPVGEVPIPSATTTSPISGLPVQYL